GVGQLMGTGVAAGTIDYRNGAVSLEFGTKASLLSGNAEPFDLDNIDTSSVTMDVAVDGGSAQTITITSGDALDFTAVTAAEVKAVLDSQLVGATASIESGKIRITSDSFGPDSSLKITAGTDNLNDSSDGL